MQLALICRPRHPREGRTCNSTDTCCPQDDPARRPAGIAAPASKQSEPEVHVDCGEKFNACCLVGGGGARSRDRASSCSFVSEFDHALDCWHQDASDCDRSQVPPAPAMGAMSRPPCPAQIPLASPPRAQPCDMSSSPCMHDCVCIFACMPRDASVKNAWDNTHQVRLRNDVSMPVPDAVPSSWSARTW